eukprot:TRINITY_DN31106_c0_g1_i1.p1 TRINITY_DN31106_c0_g1~~TRINITY_DN31106_c0_g1_i1.p1  ORF type:complete len:500 (+),score=67.14 TRINITY_DN31106_c0_g1_i1:76-1500(+)
MGGVSSLLCCEAHQTDSCCVSCVSTSSSGEEYFLANTVSQQQYFRRTLLEPIPEVDEDLSSRSNIGETNGTSDEAWIARMIEQTEPRNVEGDADRPKTVPRPLAVAESGSTASSIKSAVKELLRKMQIFEAAKLWQEFKGIAEDKEAVEIDDTLRLYLRALGNALDCLGRHPGLGQFDETVNAKGTVVDGNQDSHADSLLDVSVASSPKRARLQSAEKMEAQGLHGSRDFIDFDFDLDESGHKVTGRIEFFADGTVSIDWTAVELPLSVARILCMVHEVDLLGDIAPYIDRSEVLHQFPFNAADRLIRIITDPPIPFVGGVEAVIQRCCFDLLGTPWGAFCLFDSAPGWKTAHGKGVPEPPLFRAGLRKAEVKEKIAVVRMAGQRGELSTLLFSAKIDTKISRRLLPNWLVSWLVKIIARTIFERAMNLVSKFDATEHGSRLQSNPLYQEVSERIEAILAAKARTAESEKNAQK